MAKAKRARRSSFRTMQSGDDVLTRLDAIEALEAAEEKKAQVDVLPEVDPAEIEDSPVAQ